MIKQELKNAKVSVWGCLINRKINGGSAAMK